MIGVRDPVLMFTAFANFPDRHHRVHTHSTTKKNPNDRINENITVCERGSAIAT